jgi:hypothetical protein
MLLSLQPSCPDSITPLLEAYTQYLIYIEIDAYTLHHCVNASLLLYRSHAVIL